MFTGVVDERVSLQGSAVRKRLRAESTLDPLSAAPGPLGVLVDARPGTDPAATRRRDGRLEDT